MSYESTLMCIHAPYVKNLSMSRPYLCMLIVRYQLFNECQVAGRSCQHATQVPRLVPYVDDCVCESITNI